MVLVVVGLVGMFFLGRLYCQVGNRDHHTLSLPGTAMPVHFGGTYTMACVCSNQPAPNAHYRFPAAYDDGAGLEAIQQTLAADSEVVSVRCGT